MRAHAVHLNSMRLARRIDSVARISPLVAVTYGTYQSAPIYNTNSLTFRFAARTNTVKNISFDCPSIVNAHEVLVSSCALNSLT